MNLTEVVKNIGIGTFFVSIIAYICFFYDSILLLAVSLIFIYIVIANKMMINDNIKIYFMIALLVSYLILNSLVLSRAYLDVWNVIFLGIIAFTIAISIRIKDYNDRYMMYWFIIIGFIVSIGVITDYYLYNSRFWYDKNPNYLGFFLAVIGPIAIGSIFTTNYKKLKFILLIAALCIVTSIIITSCRGSLLALLISVLFMAWLLRNYWLFPVCLSYSFLMSYLTNNVIGNRIITPILTQDINSFTTGRFNLWRAAWSIFYKSPIFGCGLGNYRFQSLEQGIAGLSLWSSQPMMSAAPHNAYLQILAESGIVGAILFIIVFTLIFFPVIRLRLKLTESIDIYLAIYTASSVAFLTQNLTNSLMFHRFESIIGWLMMGLVVCRLQYLRQTSGFKY